MVVEAARKKEFDKQIIWPRITATLFSAMAHQRTIGHMPHLFQRRSLLGLPPVSLLMMGPRWRWSSWAIQMYDIYIYKHNINVDATLNANSNFIFIQSGICQWLRIYFFAVSLSPCRHNISIQYNCPIPRSIRIEFAKNKRKDLQVTHEEWDKRRIDQQKKKWMKTVENKRQPIYWELLNRIAAPLFFPTFIFYFRFCSHPNKNRKHQSGLNERPIISGVVGGTTSIIINIPVIHPDSRLFLISYSDSDRWIYGQFRIVSSHQWMCKSSRIAIDAEEQFGRFLRWMKVSTSGQSRDTENRWPTEWAVLLLLLPVMWQPPSATD